MIKRLRNLVLFLVLGLVTQAQLMGQSHPPEALESPLSTVFYLLSTTDKDERELEKVCLAKSLVGVDRFEEVLRTIEMVERGSYVEEEFVGIVHQLVDRGNLNQASTLVTYLLNRFAGDGYKLEKLIRPMILLRRDSELYTLIEGLDDSEKIDLWFLVSDAYREVGRLEKALEVLEKTNKAVMESEYDEDRAKLAYRYAKLGRETEAVNLAGVVSSKLDPNTRNIDVVFDLARAYFALGKYAEANELYRKHNDGLDIDETRDIIDLATRLISNGKRQMALDTLEQALAQLNPKVYGDSFNLGRIIEIYLQLGEIRKAEQVALRITGSDYMQQGQLLAIADRFIKAGNKTKAREVLRYALKQTYKIDTSEEESGSLWTSGKWDQARYQSQIAIRLMEMRDDKEALRLTAQLKKPYLRALILTEYVAINKKRHTSKKLKYHLDEAFMLLQQKNVDIFDSRRFDVFAITARSFAEIGLAKRSNEAFAETLTKLDEEILNDGSKAGLLFSLCRIGVEFDKPRITADENVRSALRKIIYTWERDEY